MAGLTLPDIEAATRYDGSPILEAGGCFVAGLASHPSAEPGSLVVRADSSSTGTSCSRTRRTSTISPTTIAAILSCSRALRD